MYCIFSIGLKQIAENWWYLSMLFGVYALHVKKRRCCKAPSSRKLSPLFSGWGLVGWWLWGVGCGLQRAGGEVVGGYVVGPWYEQVGGAAEGIVVNMLIDILRDLAKITFHCTFCWIYHPSLLCSNLAHNFMAWKEKVMQRHHYKLRPRAATLWWWRCCWMHTQTSLDRAPVVARLWLQVSWIARLRLCSFLLEHGADPNSLTNASKGSRLAPAWFECSLA